MPGLSIGIIAIGVAAAVVLAVPVAHEVPWMARAAVVLGLVAMVAGPAASTLYTINTGYSGSIVSAGPTVTDAQNGGGIGFAGGGPGAGLGGPGFGGTQPPGSGGAPGGGTAGGGAPIGGAVGGQNGADSALTSYLVANRGSATWIVATSGSGSAASIELATGEAVMAMGGFNGSDPAPTLDELKADVASGQLRYVLIDGQGGGPGGGSSDVTSWVEANGTVVDYGSTAGGALYDLTAAGG